MTINPRGEKYTDCIIDAHQCMCALTHFSRSLYAGSGLFSHGIDLTTPVLMSYLAEAAVVLVTPGVFSLPFVGRRSASRALFTHVECQLLQLALNWRIKDTLWQRFCPVSE